jgi:hypothetical protein
VSDDGLVHAAARLIDHHVCQPNGEELIHHAGVAKRRDQRWRIAPIVLALFAKGR